MVHPVDHQAPCRLKRSFLSEFAIALSATSFSATGKLMSRKHCTTQ